MLSYAALEARSWIVSTLHDALGTKEMVLL